MQNDFVKSDLLTCVVFDFEEFRKELYTFV